MEGTQDSTPGGAISRPRARAAASAAPAEGAQRRRGSDHSSSPVRPPRKSKLATKMKRFCNRQRSAGIVEPSSQPGRPNNGTRVSLRGSARTIVLLPGHAEGRLSSTCVRQGALRAVAKGSRPPAHASSLRGNSYPVKRAGPALLLCRPPATNEKCPQGLRSSVCIRCRGAWMSRLLHHDPDSAYQAYGGLGGWSRAMGGFGWGGEVQAVPSLFAVVETHQRMRA